VVGENVIGGWGNKIEKTKEIEKPLPQDKSQGADDNEWD